MHTLGDAILGAIDATGVPFELIDIDPRYSDTAAFCEKYRVPLERSANTILIASKTQPKRYAACVVQGMRRLDVNHRLRALMGARLSFATPEEAASLTGMMIGGITIFGLPETIPVFIDEPLLSLDWIILGGGSRSVKVKMSPEVLRRIPNATITKISL